MRGVSNRHWISKMLNNFFSGVLAEDELIPFIANKDFSAHDMDLDSLLTDKTAGKEIISKLFLNLMQLFRN